MSESQTGFREGSDFFGPFFFCIFIIEISSVVSKCESIWHQKFVDDVAALVSGTAFGLQTQLNVTYVECCLQWHLNINVDDTKMAECMAVKAKWVVILCLKNGDMFYLCYMKHI